MHSFSSVLTHIATLTFGTILGVTSLFQPQLKHAIVAQPSVTQQHTATSTLVIATKKTPTTSAHKKKTISVIAVSPTKTMMPVPVAVLLPPQKTPSPVSVDTPPLPSTILPIPSLPIDEVNTTLRSSLVNILCTTKAGGSFRPISGSGVIIDTRGIILTNAHVAQFFLLKDYPYADNVNCVIRTGSPASTKYNARLLYIPETWVKENASQFKSPEATGTGENDYAFLIITSTTSGSPLPSKFPAVSISLDQPAKGDKAVSAAYPAQFLGGTTIQLNLFATSAVTPIEDVYTFNTGTIDVLAIGSTVVSQSGSSGGGVARVQDGALVGIITTATEGSSTATRNLRAITLAHIDRSLQSFGKGGLVSFLLNGDLQQKADDFNTIIAPNLTKLLTDALK